MPRRAACDALRRQRSERFFCLALLLLQALCGAALAHARRCPRAPAPPRQSAHLHRVPVAAFARGPPYAATHAWVFQDAAPLPRPVRYDHPPGAVIWVNLDEPEVC